MNPSELFPFIQAKSSSKNVRCITEIAILPYDTDQIVGGIKNPFSDNLHCGNHGFREHEGEQANDHKRAEAACYQRPESVERNQGIHDKGCDDDHNQSKREQQQCLLLREG